MSWSVTAAGEASKVATTFAQKVDEIVNRGAPDFEVAILRAHQQIVQRVCEASNPNANDVIAESNGHIDMSSGGTGDLRIRRVWN